MSFPKGEDLLMMGSEAAKMAEAYQESLRRSQDTKKPISGDPIKTVSETVNPLPLHSGESIKGPCVKKCKSDIDTSKIESIYPKLPSAPPETLQTSDKTEHTSSSISSPDTTDGKEKRSACSAKAKSVKFSDDKPGKYSRFEMEALELLSDPDDENDKESSILGFEERTDTGNSIEMRLDAIEEKLSMILGLLKTLSIATAGPTAARDGIRDAMIGMREELVASILSEAKDKIADMIREEENQRCKIGDGGAKLSEKAKELNTLTENESSSGESDTEEATKSKSDGPDSDDDLYSFDL
nr:phosphoprotein [Avian metapneumovirus]